jgi:hypothetical protein
MQDQEAKGKVMNMISKPKITKSDVAELVDFTLGAKPVVKLKEKMRLLIEDTLSLTNDFPNAKPRNKLKALLSFMLEDL